MSADLVKEWCADAGVTGAACRVWVGSCDDVCAAWGQRV